MEANPDECAEWRRRTSDSAEKTELELVGCRL
jgi:hypothetical protein